MLDMCVVVEMMRATYCDLSFPEKAFLHHERDRREVTSLPCRNSQRLGSSVVKADGCKAYCHYQDSTDNGDDSVGWHYKSALVNQLDASILTDIMSYY